MTPYAIVLSTYNGHAHVEEQLESIRAQTAADWRLYVRDDGSSDDTWEKLGAWAARDARIHVLERDGRNLGAAASFGVLLQHALDRGETRVFLADQDDVWVPHKCERMLATLGAREAVLGADAPLLVHSDLTVVDDDLKPLHASFIALQRIEQSVRAPAACLLVGNCVTGCATLVNASLLRCALPMPDVAMHDWWLAQCAAACGEITFLPEAMVLYRQHGRNAVGAIGMGERAAASLRSPAAWWSASARRFLRGLHQVWVLRSRARVGALRVSPEVGRSLDVLWEGLGEPSASAYARLTSALDSGALPPVLLRRFLFLARVALLPTLRSRFGDERAGAHEISKVKARA